MMVQKMHRHSNTVSSVGVESLTTLSPEFAIIDHLDQQRGGGVLVVCQSLMQDVHDVQQGVQAD
jgi:hypothetical protein